MDSDQNISEFNGAIAFLQRLHVSQVITGEARRNLDAYSWYMELYNFHSELAPLMKDTEERELIKELNALNDPIQKSMGRNNRVQTNSIEPELFNKLMDLEIKYKKVIKKSNLLTKLRDDASYSLE